MKKLLLKLALFSGLTLIVWLGVFVITLQSYGLEYSIFGKETNWGFTNLRSSEWGLQKELGNNVLFFGASTCYSGIDPSALSAFGLSGFNFCSSSQAIGNSAHLILPAISSQIPQAIIVDVCPEIWGAQAPYLESTKDWIINSNLRTPEWSRAYRRLAFESGDIFTFLSSFYYDFARKFKVAGANPYLEKDTKGDYRGLGFVARSFEPLDTIECETLKRKMSKWECGAILDIAALCSSKRIQLILINPPQLCEETFDMPPCFDGLAYIDGNAWPGAKTPRNFYDDHHLVEAGALSYSAWLAQQIASLLHAS